MTVKFLSPEKALNLLEISGTSIRPREIINLKEEIEGEIRAAELRCSITNTIDQIHVQKIVGMKLRLDGLYIDWSEGRI